MLNKIDQIINDLCKDGISIQDDFLEPGLIQLLRNDFDQILQQNLLKKAQIGLNSHSNLNENTEIRRDKTFWIEEQFSSASSQYFEFMQILKQQINQNLYLGLTEFECHFALYEKGDFYKKHFDQHANSPYRFITCILYMTSNYKTGDGGELVVYRTKQEPLKIEPQYNRFICFVSENFEHEVLESQINRVSLTGWLRKTKVI